MKGQECILHTHGGREHVGRDNVPTLRYSALSWEWSTVMATQSLVIYKSMDQHNR